MFSGESVDSVYLCDELIEDRRPFDLPFSIDFVSIILLQKTVLGKNTEIQTLVITWKHGL